MKNFKIKTSTLFSILIFTCSTISSFSQISVQFKTGLDCSIIKFSSADYGVGYKTTKRLNPSILYGLSIGKLISQRITLSASFYYTRKKFPIEYDIPSTLGITFENSPEEARFHYFNFTLLGKNQISNWFSLGLGPNFGLTRKTEIDWAFSNLNAAKFETYEIGIRVSAEFQYKKFSMELSALNPFIYIQKEELRHRPQLDSNKSFSLTLNYLLIGKNK